MLRCFGNFSEALSELMWNASIEVSSAKVATDISLVVERSDVIGCTGLGLEHFLVTLLILLAEGVFNLE